MLDQPADGRFRILHAVSFRCSNALLNGGRTARSGGASRPSRRGSECSPLPRSCSTSEATRVRASPGLPSEPVSPRRRCTRTSGTSGRCWASSSVAPSAAATRGPFPSKRDPRRSPPRPARTSSCGSFAADIAGRLERAAPLVAIVSGAARSEPDLAELLARLHADRLKNLRVFVDALAHNGPLRLDEDEALETVWALTSPELHQLLRRVRGWTRKRYSQWLAGSLATLLLQADAS